MPAHRGERRVGGVDELAGVVLGDAGEQHQIAQPLQQVAGEPARLSAAVENAGHGVEHAGSVAGRDRGDNIVEDAAVGHPELGDHLGLDQPVRTCAAHDLPEHAQRVARTARSGARDHRQRTRLGRDALLLAHPGEVLLQHPCGDEPERVVVGARADGADDLVRLGGGEHELQVRGRLFDELEQRVGCGVGELVRLVDDVDPVARLHRREHRALSQVAGLINTAVGGRVDLENIDRTGAVGREVHTRGAGAARGGGRSLLTVQAAREDARR